jgi:2-keto-3-deoxy-L-fuconate dehydrogenase
MQDILKGRRALVTGAASGIGAAIAARFTEAGALVAGLDLEPSLGVACPLVADLRSDAQLDAACDILAGGIGMPDIVVHAAALQRKGGVLDTRPEDYAEVYDVNVIGAVRLMRRCVPHMRREGRGAIVLLSSINASFATPTLAAYAASKAALENLAKTAALEFAPDGIRVNAIAPASIDTPMLRASYADSQEGAFEANKARHPLARFGSAAEVAELALFLASDSAGWITGAIYPIDGGASVTRR